MEYIWKDYTATDHMNKGPLTFPDLERLFKSKSKKKLTELQRAEQKVCLKLGSLAHAATCNFH